MDSTDKQVIILAIIGFGGMGLYFGFMIYQSMIQPEAYVPVIAKEVHGGNTVCLFEVNGQRDLGSCYFVQVGDTIHVKKALGGYWYIIP